MKTIVLHLSQVAMARPGADDRRRFNDETIVEGSVEKTLEKLRNSHGITVPRKPRGIFTDGPEGPVQTGFMSCRWNSDCSHGGNSWWEENWITFLESESRNVELPAFLKDKSF